MIVEALQTPLGGRKGALSNLHPVDLSVRVLRAPTEPSGLDPPHVVAVAIPR